jgi:sec-independent protein translocase protein TatC
MNNEHHEPQTLYAHLAELRNRLIYSILAWLIAASISYIMIADIMQWLTAPLAAAYESPESKRLIFTSLPEAFLTYIQLAMISGFFSFPVIVWQLYRFIAPALYARERRATLPFLIAAPCLFYAGAALAYFYIFPAAWKFFVSFEMLASPSIDGGLPIELEAKLSEYLSLISGIIIAFGVSFQLPLVLLLLIKAKVVDVATLKRSRRYAIVGLLIVSAVLTPPDIISQIGLFVPLYALYEFAIFAGKFIQKSDDEPKN